MINRDVPHLLVLPEDRANAQIVNGFFLHPIIDYRRVKTMKEAGGWREVLKQFEEIHVRDLQNNPHAYLVLLLDFDGHLERLKQALEVIPSSLSSRVFVLGCLKTPEDLRKNIALGNFENIGKALAGDCESNAAIWHDARLRHNLPELQRLHFAVSRFVLVRK